MDPIDALATSITVCRDGIVIVDDGNVVHDIPWWRLDGYCARHTDDGGELTVHWHDDEHDDWRAFYPVEDMTISNEDADRIAATIGASWLSWQIDALGGVSGPTYRPDADGGGA